MNNHIQNIREEARQLGIEGYNDSESRLLDAAEAFEEMEKELQRRDNDQEAITQDRREMENLFHILHTDLPDSELTMKEMAEVLIERVCENVTKEIRKRLAEVTKDRDSMIWRVIEDDSENCPFCSRYAVTGHSQQSPQCPFCSSQEKQGALLQQLAAVIAERDALKSRFNEEYIDVPNWALELLSQLPSCEIIPKGIRIKREAFLKELSDRCRTFLSWRDDLQKLKTKVKHALHLSHLRSEPYLPAETRREIEDILSKALGEDKV